ncbi:sulfurtransferase [Candidatus Thiodiazotropha sp. CDECU1]|uniref:sulfurtransferase n=1 Tax=Candidatus Thiodiazotropha sp. CDECU1 TaxID=3065865 RepID=UPI00292F5566|nr:rhodanese-like domain-containing protein [Candidatus Thiodiazotropha sp. CDECU1]
MSLLLRILALLGCLWSYHLSAAPLPVLVDGSWLSQNKSKVVVLDVRTRIEFMGGHWPQARWAGFKERDWQVARYGLPGYLPDEKKLAELLGSLGLEGKESVIVIGSARQPRRVAEAARVVWSLMMAGFQQVALLDGGIESLSTHDLVKGMPSVVQKECTMRFQPDLLADSNHVEDLLGNNRPVIDLRPKPYFEGYKRDPQVPEGGTIYDGVGIPPERLLDGDTGRFLPSEIIQQEFERYDIQTMGELATFSDTGVWAALGWFVLHQMLQNPKARLYDGSLVEWIDWGGEMHDSTDDMGGPIG